MAGGISKEDAQAMFDQAVQILREDAGLAQNRALMARLDAIERQTRKEPQTPEEKAAAYDKLMAQNGGHSGTPANVGNNPTQTPPSGSGTPTPPNPKPPAQSQESTPDWWWGSNDG